MNNLEKPFIDQYAIILTCSVHTGPQIDCLHQRDPNTRKNLYIRSITNWITKTEFKIIVVENSGEFFPELNSLIEKYKDRLEFFSINDYDQFPHIRDHRSKGIHEICAIDYAIEHSSLIRSCNFVIKITGRFFIPGLESFLSKKDSKHFEALRQSDPSRCEMLGCHLSQINNVFKPSLDPGDPYDFMEQVWKNRIDSIPRIIQCPLFPISSTPRGGVNSCYDNI